MKLKQIRVDGYKNLIDCKLYLGDFNVLVGPNNSGKSNFLEIFQTLFALFWGQRVDVFLRSYPSARWASPFCELDGYMKKGITIAIGFDVDDMDMEGQTWVCEYSVSAARATEPPTEEGRNLIIEKETLEGKPRGRPGPRTVFWKREGTKLTVATRKGSKHHSVAPTISVPEFLRSAYPQVEDLGEHCAHATVEMQVDQPDVLGLSPDELRAKLSSDTELPRFSVRGCFDILLEVDRVYANKGLARLFETNLCDILDLEGVHFTGQDVHAKGNKAAKTEFVKRLRSFAVKKKGGSFSSIENYSDGTLIVVAILAALLSEEPKRALLCIEEPENYLHPRALEKLLRFLQDNAHRWPVLITTHSPYLLNGVNPKDVTVAVVDKTGAAHFEKFQNVRQLTGYLNKSLMSFGDLMPSNFEEVLGRK
jgi:energy-coupling factor transporter ATP-binding protein EcfA2